MTRHFVLLALLVAVGAHAQTTPIAISGQIRQRSELDARDVGAEEGPLLFHLLRTRLGVTARPTANLTAVVQVQDSRYFGGEDPALGRGTLDGDADQLDVHQAYVDAVDLLGVGLGVRVGRQELAYGNERLVGAVGWSNVGRSFDGAVLRLRRDGLAADLFAAGLVSPVLDVGAQHLVGLYTAWAVAEGHALDAFALFDNDAAEILEGPDAGADRLARFTPGLFAHGTAGRAEYSAEAVGQVGRTARADGGPRDAIRAWLVSAGAGYVVAPAHGVRLGATYTRLSGDADPADGTGGTFQTLFATNHKFYGFMDYFPALSGARGLQDVVLSARVAPSPAVLLALDVHQFATAAGPTASFGQEVDLTATYRPAPGVVLGAGASAFFPGAAADEALGDDAAGWLYLTSSVSF